MHRFRLSTPGVHRGLMALLLLAMGLPGTAPATPDLDETVPVEVELYLIDIDGIDDVQQNFVANLFVQATWTDPELAHDGSREISRPLSAVWNPRLQIINQQRLVKTLPDIVEVSSDGRVTWRQRYWGSFSQPLDLQEFPFDQQRLSFQVVAVGFSESEVSLHTSDRSGLAPSFSVPDWEFVEHAFEPSRLPLGAAGADLPILDFFLVMKRHEGYYLIKVVLPLVLIVIMSMLVFWIDPELSATQIGVGTTAMLTLIAYRFAVGATLPRLSFLTRLDYFILASTLLVFTSLIMVIWTSHLARNGQADRARTIERRARGILPVLFVVLALETLVFNLLF